MNKNYLKKNKTNEEKQKIKDCQKQYRENRTNEQKQKMKDYQKKYQNIKKI